MSTFSCITINDLEQIQFIAGTEYLLTFSVYDASGSPVNLSTATTSWVMSPYGESVAALTKSGSVSGSVANNFMVTLYAGDTSGSSGVFIHQPVIVDFGGGEFRPSQGKILITPAIL